MISGFIQDYMRDMASYGTFRASLDADMKVREI